MTAVKGPSSLLSLSFLFSTLAPVGWAQAPRRPEPLIDLKSARHVPTHYSGAQAFAVQSATPLSLATADFDEDGMPDLASGYAAAGGGVLTIHRGNVQSLWPYGAALRNGTPPEFLPDALVLTLPEAPDFLGAGDFDADGHWDIVAVKSGSRALYFLRGDGHGGFAPAEKIDLPGAATAMTTGEINRRDGLTDIAVGITTDAGAQVLVFEWPEGALRGKPETLSIPAAAASLTMAPLDDSGMYSLAVAAGRDLVVFHGRDRRLTNIKKVRDAVPAAEMTRQSFSFGLRALTAGKFTSDLLDLAALGDDGKVHFLERADADYQAALAAQPRSAPGLPGMLPSGRKLGAPAPAMPKKPAGREMTMRSEVLLPFSTGVAARLIAAHTSLGQSDELLALDGESGQIHFLARESAAAGRERTMRLALSSKVPQGAAAAVLPMRLRPGAIHSLVMLTPAQREPVVAHAGPPTVFTVTNTADSAPSGGTLENTDIPGSLRTAITNARHATAPTSIVFNIPVTDPNYNPATGVFIIKPLPNTNCGGDGGFFVTCETLPEPPAGCTIDGYTQPGGTLNAITQPAASPNTLTQGDNAVLKIEINGALAGQGPSGLNLFDGTGTVRGLIFTGFSLVLPPGGANSFGGNGIAIQSNTNFVEGNFTGIESTGVTAKPNSIGIGDFGSGNTIGGTTPQARNLIGNGYTSAVLGTPADTVQGNYAGTDRTGTFALDGGGLLFAGQGSTIGGTAAGSSNLSSGSGVGLGIQFVSGNSFTPDNNLAMGNIFGLDVTGTTPVGNTVGVTILSGNKNQIGGTTPAARNIISGNFSDGVQITDAADQNVIEGNFIGVDITGTVKRGNFLDGINQTLSGTTPNAALTTIGGEAAGAGNVISNNGSNGIEFGGPSRDFLGNSGDSVLGNLIGTDLTGTVNMGNGGDGIRITQASAPITIGNTDTPSTNTIAFNTGNGITIDPSTGNTFTGVPLGFDSIVNNLIFSNGGAGVRVISGANNKISQNSIFSNAALGIDIAAAGPQAINTACNPPTNGANSLQNAPALTPATGTTTLISATATDPNGNTSEFSNCAAQGLSGGILNVAGTLNAATSTAYRIEVFQNTSCDVSAFGQGKTFVTAFTVNTNAQCLATFGTSPNLNNADVSVSTDFNHSQFSTFANPGSTFTYLITVTNSGPGSAANVVLSDPFPSGASPSITVNSASITQGSCITVSNTVTCNIGTMASGATAVATIAVTVNAVGSLSQTAIITSTSTDPNSANNSSTLTLNSSYADAIIDHLSVTSVAAGTSNLPIVVVGLGFLQGITTVSFSPALPNGTPQPAVTFLTNQACGAGTNCVGLSFTIPAVALAAQGTLTITTTNPTPGGGSTSANLTILPSAGNVTHFLLTGIPASSLENTNYTLTVTALDASNNVVAAYRGVANITDPDGFGFPAFTPTSPYTFTAGDNGVHNFNVIFSNTSFFGPDVITVSDAGTPSITGSLTTTVNVLLGPPAFLQASQPPPPQTIGFPFGTLSAFVSDESSNGLPNVSVTFTAPGGTGNPCPNEGPCPGGTFSNGQNTITVNTDSTGTASVVLTANLSAGSFTVNAAVTTAPSVTGQFSLTSISTLPAHLTIHAGNNQTSPLNTQFRFDPSVIVTDSNNQTLTGIPVTFTAQTVNGATGVLLQPSVAFSERTVDPVPGLAFTPSPPFANGVAGSYTITATVQSASVPVPITAVFTETNSSTPNPVAGVSIAFGEGQSTGVNSAFANQLTAHAFDAQGNLLSNVPITFSAPATGASATFGANPVNTDPATGNASVNVTANGTVGAYTITATNGAFSDTTTFTNTAGTNNILTANAGTPQTTAIGTAFPAMLQAKLTDSSGTPLSGQTVTFTAPSAGPSLNIISQTATTNASGIASIAVIANSTVGTYSVTASAPASTGSVTLVTATFSLTNAAQAPAHVNATGGTPQSAAINTAFGAALQVTVTDSAGTPISGVPVNFAAPGTGASASVAASAVTNGSGIATVTATANTTVGSYSVTASVGQLTATFSLTNTAGAAASITATAGTPQSAATNAAFATLLQAIVKDAAWQRAQRRFGDLRRAWIGR